MEKDEQLKQLVSLSAEGASPNFTDAVMKRVNGLSGASLYNQPLVSPVLKKIFLLAFGTSIAAILVLCIVIAFASVNVGDWMQNSVFADLNYSKILLFLITFWIVFAANAFVEKMFLHSRKSLWKMH